MTEIDDEPPVPKFIRNHLLRNARIVADRTDILDKLPKDITFVEIGVALGDFTSDVFKRCSVKVFYAIDMFDLEKYPRMWQGRVGDVLSGRTHVEYYESRFSSQLSAGVLRLMVGDSVNCINSLADKSIDVFYVDANHSYKNVKAEIIAMKSKIKDDGIIIFNDYLMYDWVANVKYGVVQAVNEFMVDDGWEMLYFALHPGMYCDVALKRL